MSKNLRQCLFTSPNSKLVEIRQSGIKVCVRLNISFAFSRKLFSALIRSYLKIELSQLSVRQFGVENRFQYVQKAPKLRAFVWSLVVSIFIKQPIFVVLSIPPVQNIVRFYWQSCLTKSRGRHFFICRTMQMYQTAIVCKTVLFYFSMPRFRYRCINFQHWKTNSI